MGSLNKPVPPGKPKLPGAGATNARDLFPNLKEDVVEGTRVDSQRIRKGLDPSAESPAQTAARRNAPQGNLSVKDAGGRAISRMGGRAGLAGTALGVGYEAGRELDEKTGAGKKLVEETGLGKAAERAAKPREKVELSEYAKRRLDEEEVDRLTRETKAKAEAERTRKADQDKWDEGRAYKRGGKVSASSRGDGIAKRGRTRGRII